MIHGEFGPCPCIRAIFAWTAHDTVAYGRHVDEIEVGRPLGESVRIAVKVDDLEESTKSVIATGTEPQAEPVETPWGDRNRRFTIPGGLQLTLFQSPE